MPRIDFRFFALSLVVILLLAVYAALPRSALDSEPEDVDVTISTTVIVDSAGVALMRSRTEIQRPVALANLLRNLASEREYWLQGIFHQSIRTSLEEQPWKTGEVSVTFDRSPAGAFVTTTDVIFYEYSWVEDPVRGEWYSPGVITEQETMIDMIGVMKMLGQSVSNLRVRSEAHAYWPAGAKVTATLPFPGSYRSQSAGAVFDYVLDVWVEESTQRPVVYSRFDFDVAATEDAQIRMREAFYGLLAKTGVDPETRNVYIRYELPVPPEIAAGGIPQFVTADKRWPAVGLLVVALVTAAWFHRRLRRGVRV